MAPTCDEVLHTRTRSCRHTASGIGSEAQLLAPQKAASLPHTSGRPFRGASYFSVPLFGGFGAGLLHL
jgi:hypothetical protein